MLWPTQDLWMIQEMHRALPPAKFLFYESLETVRSGIKLVFTYIKSGLTSTSNTLALLIQILVNPFSGSDSYPKSF